MTKLGFTPRETCRAFSISHNALRLAVKNGELTTYGIGRKSILLADDVVRWIRRHKPTSSSKPQENSHVL